MYLHHFMHIYSFFALVIWRTLLQICQFFTGECKSIADQCKLCILYKFWKQKVVIFVGDESD